MRLVAAAATAMVGTECTGSFPPVVVFPITKQRAIQDTAGIGGIVIK
jgi:hypothetical protein